VNADIGPLRHAKLVRVGIRWKANAQPNFRGIIKLSKGNAEPEWMQRSLHKIRCEPVADAAAGPCFLCQRGCGQVARVRIGQARGARSVESPALDGKSRMQQPVEVP
jgi:hypothetical protein